MATAWLQSRSKPLVGMENLACFSEACTPVYMSVFFLFRKYTGKAQQSSEDCLRKITEH